MLPFLISALVLTAVAAVWDLKTGRIPNWLTLGGLVAGVVGHVVQGFLLLDWRTALQGGGFAVAGSVFCSIAPAVLYWKGGMGGGDLKLFAALGALCHPLIGIEAQMYGLMLAAVFAPARLVYEGRFLAVMGSTLAMLLNPLRPRERRRQLAPEMLTWFRLGPAIFGGTVLAFVAHAPALLG